MSRSGWPWRHRRMTKVVEGTVADISDESLLRRAVANCRARKIRTGTKHARWIAVMDTFALGSTYAHQLCRRFDFDPDEMVER